MFMSNTSCENSWLSEAYLKHRDRLIEYTFGFVRDRAEAECIVQGAFQEAGSKEHIKDYAVKWLTRVCHNHAIDFVRHRAKVNYYDPADLFSEESNFETEVDISPVEIVLDKESTKELQVKKQELLEAINKLKNPSLRRVIELRYFENKTYQEISEIMKIKLGNVGFKLNYAIKLLKRHLINK